MCQVANVSCNDNKALAELAGARRFNGAVDGQHVGLDRNRTDGLDDLVDAPGYQFQIIHLLDAGARGFR